MRALDLVRERYADFGPTLAREKLRELHGVDVARETLRKWMGGAGVWLTRDKRRAKAHQPRHRRECLGELVQIDGSPHAWFEDPGPGCSLLVTVNRALLERLGKKRLRFTDAERKRLAVLGKKLGRKALAEVCDGRGAEPTSRAPSGLDR